MTVGRPLSSDAIAFIAQSNSAYLATSGEEGQPYVQHRGGPAGFVRVLDDRTLAFADYAGNRQYMTVGNLAHNDRAFMFLMDYAAARRLKLWGRAHVVCEDTQLFARVTDAAYGATVEQVIVFTLSAWEWNCSRHIPRLVPAVE
jgi:predicted pyridoxine 5'-phosphate oxidase superfamily flavin-nucleotide-binding protein